MCIDVYTHRSTVVLRRSPSWRPALLSLAPTPTPMFMAAAAEEVLSTFLFLRPSSLPVVKWVEIEKGQSAAVSCMGLEGVQSTHAPNKEEKAPFTRSPNPPLASPSPPRAPPAAGLTIVVVLRRAIRPFPPLPPPFPPPLPPPGALRHQKPCVSPAPSQAPTQAARMPRRGMQPKKSGSCS